MSRTDPFAYRRFIALSLFSGLFIGSLSGAIFLFRLRLGTNPVELIQKQAHGHLQIFGFVFPLILGIAYQALPRFLGTHLRSADAVRLSFGGAVSCVLLWSVVLIAAPMGTAAAILHALAASSEIAATAAFTIAVFQIWRDAKHPSALYLRFVLTGTFGWIIASAGDLISAGLSLTGHAGQAFAWLDAVYSAAFFLAVLPWTLGMTLRATAMFMRLPSPHERLIRGSYALILLGAGLLSLIQAGSAWTGYGPGSAALEGLSLLLLAGGILLFIAGAKIYSHLPSEETPSAFPFRAQIRISYAFLSVFSVFALLIAAQEWRSGSIERGLLQDGARHAFAAGYLLLLMTGMMAKVLPIFSGKPLKSPRTFWWGSILIALGVTLREAEILAIYFHAPWLMRISGLSGWISCLGILLSVLPVGWTLLPESRPSDHL